MPDLKVGDTVLWRGAWGSHPEKRARVTSIQVNEVNGAKYGTDVQSVAWSTVVERKVIVNLDVECGPNLERFCLDQLKKNTSYTTDRVLGTCFFHWAWADQIRPDLRARPLLNIGEEVEE